ncbi:MAG: phosphatidate cytidylyltransferase [Acidimicrobiia bacterium]|nr:phosphatidate cytidylyltransferase [Acidimicrobiia bacterium]
MSHRDDDGGNGAESDDGSLEDEFRDWVGETAEAGGGAEETPRSRGWLGRVFSRGKSGDEAEEPAPAAMEDSVEADADASYDPRSGSDPDSLSVFAAVTLEDQDDGAETPPAVPDPEPGEETPPADPAAVSEEVDAPPPESLPDEVGDEETIGSAPGDEEPLPEVAELPPAGQESDAGQATFAELWGSQDEGVDDDDEDIVDFATFTSEDYLQATTREYAGLAEAVARAEEEGTERLAVSAEIPGLESGIVGLDDVVGTTGDDTPADVVEPPAASDLPIRVLTAFGLVVLFGASLLSPFGIGALIVVVLGIAAGEMFAALIRGGYRPLSIFGFAGVAGAFFGTWIAGPIAIPVSLLLVAVAVFLFYATVPGRRAVLENASVTLLVTAWIGGLGGFAFDFLHSDDYYWLVLALVVTVAVMDIAQYFIGRRLGRHPLAPQVSPKKTIEGYIAGVLVAVGVGAAFALADPFDLVDGLIIGAVIALVAPFGDLAVSVVKRALGVKDMGYILPGHGGVLDRVDAMIMSIPALWIAYSWMGLLA